MYAMSYLSKWVFDDVQSICVCEVEIVNTTTPIET